MPALTLAGITVPVALDQWSRLEPMLIGEDGRAFSGADLSNVRTWKEGWKAKLTPQAAATAAAFRGLTRGDGYSWSFDSDLYADIKGLGASSGSGLFVAGKYGNAISTYQAITFGVAAGSAWTISGWVFKPSLLAWHHFIRTSTGLKFKDGVSAADDPLMNISSTNLVLSPEVTLGGAVAWSSGTTYSVGDKVLESGVVWVQLDGGAFDVGEPTWSTALGALAVQDPDGNAWEWQGSNTGFDDVRFLPYVVPTSWAAQMYTEANARAHTALPRLRLAGDAAAELAAGYATITGKLMEAPLRHLTPSGSTSASTNMDQLEMELREA